MDARANRKTHHCHSLFRHHHRGRETTVEMVVPRIRLCMLLHAAEGMDPACQRLPSASWEWPRASRDGIKTRDAWRHHRLQLSKGRMKPCRSCA